MKSSVQFKRTLVVVLLTAMAPIAALSQNGTPHINSALPIIDLRSSPKSNQVAVPKFRIGTDNPVIRSIPADNKNKDDQNKIKLEQRSLRGGTGVDGGGGNVKPSNPITKDDIEKFVHSHITKVAIKMRYNEASNFEGLALFKNDPYSFTCQPMPSCFDEHFKDRHYLVSANKKLFYSPSGRTIFDAIDTAQIYVQGPACIDPQTGQEADASAFVKENAICLSYDRLSKKLSKSDIEDRLLVLLIHEYSHLQGTTEEEALAIENKLKDWHQNYNKFSQALCTFQYNYTTSFKSLWESAIEIQKNLSTLKSNQICTKLVNIYNKTNHIQDVINVQMLDDLELSSYSIFDYSTNFQITTKSINNFMFCKSTSLNYIIEDIKKDFGDDEMFELWRNLFKQDETVITSGEALKRLSFENQEIPQQYYDALSGNIRDVSVGNTEAIKIEVDEFVDALSYLRLRYKELFKVDPVVESGTCRQ